MKINSINSNISFQKTLVANTAYIKDDKVCPAKIYQLNYAEDKDYFSSLNKDEKWFYSDYLDYFEMGLKETASKKEINVESNYKTEVFAMEDENDECIAVLSVETDKHRKETNGSFFEVCPELSYENGGRKTKYIGESFISFISTWINDNLGTKFVINIPSATSRVFYKKCGFKPISDGLYLPKENIEKLAQQNKSHTGVGVNF